MKSKYLVIPALLVAIALICLAGSTLKADQKADQFEKPAVTSSKPAADQQQQPKAKKLPTLYILTTDNCGPCERFKNEILARDERAKWLIRNHKLLIVSVDGFPSVMASNGSQFTWPAGCWERSGSPLKALTDYLGYKKEASKVGINDLAEANANLVLSDASGVAQDVVCISPSGTEYSVKGDFLEDEAEPLHVDVNSEKQPRTALVDLPRTITGIAAFERKWKFRINSETWEFNGFKGKDADVQTVMLLIPGQEKITGRGSRY